MFDLLFLKTGVSSADFILDRNLPVSDDLLNYWYRLGVNISELSLIILAGIFFSRVVFEKSKLLNPLSILDTVISSKEKVPFFRKLPLAKVKLW